MTFLEREVGREADHIESHSTPYVKVSCVNVFSKVCCRYDMLPTDVGDVDKISSICVTQPYKN